MSSCGIPAILMLNCASATTLSLNFNYQMRSKHLVMDFTFDVGLATGLIKSQIYLYMHPMCVRPALRFYIEEIIFVILVMW